MMKVWNRGTLYVVEEPQVGSLVVSRDIGFGSGYCRNYVVTSIGNKPYRITISPVLSVDSDNVTYDPGKSQVLTLHFNEYTSGWHHESTQPVNIYTFDDIANYDNG